MKKCLSCGCECEDNDDFCPMCGIKFSNNPDVDYADQEIKIQFNDNNQQQSSDLDSTVESNVNTQKSTLSHLIPRNDGDKLFNSLWIVISFIPFINGFGLIYAGKKTCKRSWICEGILYELPVIFHLVSNPSFLTFGLVVLSIILSIVRSLMIIPRYKTVLNMGNYKKLNHKFISFLLFISAFIPFLNGIGFIYYGNKYSRLYLIEGFIFEMLWVVEILSLSFIPLSFYNIGTLFGIATSSLLFSGMSMISFNFDCDEFYHYVNESPFKLNKNDKKYVKDRYDYYKNQLDDLKDVFDAKEKKVRNLINKRFGSGNITSSRFLAVVDNSHDNVYKQLNSGYDLINYTSEPSQQVEEELIEIANYINSINEELEKLTVELILNMHDDVKSEDDFNNLLNDMENLIEDIDKYE
ncbi:MAG: hypothetical protein BZ138_08335 [Methanosphaera sp. rholeuAM270]|nr:MAG: hypothetical protein BZ138_08335 [Methanosphaera sp. rholeuAM270]